ncbi:MAG: fucose-binding lectin II [Spirochaetaceae bacterium]|jgi:hypothetical protein|nr:fucose-binding lectin II [Spirochaetaceae bacterium]
MSKATIKLTAVANGERMTVSVITACSNTGTITLLDDSTVYGTLKKTTSGQPQFLGAFSAIYGGGSNLRVELDITTSSLKTLVDYLAILDGAGTAYGGCYTIAVEDSTDNDYNDYVIAVLVTKKAK